MHGGCKSNKEYAISEEVKRICKRFVALGDPLYWYIFGLALLLVFVLYELDYIMSSHH